MSKLCKNVRDLYTCFYTKTLAFLHNLLIYAKPFICVIGLIDVLYDFFMFKCFYGLTMVLCTAQTGSHFNNIVVNTEIVFLLLF